MDSIVPNYQSPQNQPQYQPLQQPQFQPQSQPQSEPTKPNLDFSNLTGQTPEPVINEVRVPVAPSYEAPAPVEQVSESAPVEPESQAEVSSNQFGNMYSAPARVEPAPMESVFTPTADDTEKVSYVDSTIQELEIAKIIANPYQPRTQFKPEALQELSDSIREHGVIQPVVVTETANGYELVVGERRFRASQLAGLTKIPAIVKKTLHDQTKLEVALIENIQRQELNAIEEARGYDRLIKSFNLTQDQVAKKVGKSRSAVANTLRLLNLPAEIQRGVIEGRISEGHARAILGLGDIEKMILMYATILEQGLNVRQVENKVREIVVKRKMDAAMPDPKLMAIESELRGKLGAQVKIQRQGRGGKITIDFYSDEDLEEIMNRMAEQQQNSQNNGGNYLVV